MTAVGIADEVDDIADLEAGICQQLLGLFDADGIEQVVIALLFYCIFRIRVRGNVINLRPVHLFYAKKRQNKCSW